MEFYSSSSTFFFKFSRNNFYPPHLRYVETHVIARESIYFLFFFFFFCFLPVYWYALSFEDYHQLSASLGNKRRMKKMSQIRRDKKRKKEVNMEKDKEIEDILCGLI